MFLGPSPALGFAVGAGVSAGAFWVAAGFAINPDFSPLRSGGWETIGGAGSPACRVGTRADTLFCVPSMFDSSKVKVLFTT